MNFRQNQASYNYRNVSSLFVAVGGWLVCTPYHPHLFSSVVAAADKLSVSASDM